MTISVFIHAWHAAAFRVEDGWAETRTNVASRQQGSPCMFVCFTMRSCFWTMEERVRIWLQFIFLFVLRGDFPEIFQTISFVFCLRWLHKKKWSEMWWRKKTAFTRFIWVDLRSCHTTHYPSRDRHIVICWFTFWFLNLSWPDPNFSTVSLIWNKVSFISVIFLFISDIDPICSLIYSTSFLRYLCE